MKILSKKTEETLDLGEKIGEKLKPGMLVALEGDLGGGKTTFTKGLAKGLGINEVVTSPSFTLEKIYRIKNKKKGKNNDKNKVENLYHFDFYRIDNPKDMVGYELTEALRDKNGAIVVEWAEKIEAKLPKEKLILKFEYIDAETRKINLNAKGGEYMKLIKGL